MVQNENGFSRGCFNKFLHHVIYLLRDLHVCDVNIPLDFFEAILRIKASFCIHPHLDLVALADDSFAGANFDLRVRCCPMWVYDTLFFSFVKNKAMLTFIAKLGSIKAAETASAVVRASFASPHH